MFFSVDLFLFLHDLIQQLYRIENIYLFFFIGFIFDFFGFLSNQENQYMILHDFDLIYGSYIGMTEYNEKKTHYLPAILNYFIFFLSE